MLFLEDFETAMSEVERCREAAPEGSLGEGSHTHGSKKTSCHTSK